MPSRRIFPPLPGLGIMRSRTGIGRNDPAFTAPRRSSRNTWTPGVARDPLPRTISVAGSCTRVEQVVETAAGWDLRTRSDATKEIELAAGRWTTTPAAPARPTYPTRQADQQGRNLCMDLDGQAVPYDHSPNTRPLRRTASDDGTDS
jgi:hypothetical protein